MTTDWSKLWERYIVIGNKEVPLAAYRHQQRLDALSADAKVLLAWLAKRKKRSTYISLVELSKCLTPVGLRTSAVVRLLMAELVSGGFAEPTTGPVRYAGRWRHEAWCIGPGSI